MKRAILSIMLFLLVTPVILAADEWLYGDSATIKLRVDSSINAYSTRSNYVFDSLKINLSFVPQDTERQSVSIDYHPVPSSVGDTVLFETYNLGRLEFGYDAKINTKRVDKKVKTKIPFPNSDFPSDVKEYLKPAERIDSDNPDIIKAASLLVQGEDDYFVVVDKISNYVHKEVDYNLDTLFLKGTKDASWVLKYKEGVCSEISVLFIAMLRSIGIPARFVSGVSYTNSELFNYNWGPHAWAEVYFPDIGWIPYDITYGEFGYIDLGHITMKKTKGAEETSTAYAWKAKYVEVESSEMSMKGELLKTDESLKQEIVLNAKPYYDKVGFMSYNLIVVEVTNPNDYYVSKRIKIATTEGLEMFDKERQVVLRPHEKKTTHFIVKTVNMDKKYIYTFPITIYTEQEEMAKTEFRSASSSRIYSESQIIDVAQQIASADEKIYKKDVAFSCYKREYYVDEQILMKCTLENLGNLFLDDLNVCFATDCKKADLGISQEENFNFTIKPNKPGQLKIPITIKNDELSEEDNLYLDILDLPSIKITNVSYPSKVNFEEEFEIAYIIKRESDSEPKRIVAKIIINNEPRTLDIDELKDKFVVKTKLWGEELTEESNIELLVEYQDALGRTYESSKEVQISLNELTVSQKMIVLWNRLEAGLNKLINKIPI